MQALEKESSKVNFRNLFLELEIKEANSDKFSGLTTMVADTYANKPLNRYYNVLAYDQSRVKLKYKRDEIYINACYVNVPDADRKYILTQGPLEETVDHFWLMCQETVTNCIVMLCRCYENSRDKSAQYWPSKVGETLRTGVGLSVELLDESETGNFIVRNLKLTDTSTGSSRDIRQLHYIHWPDFNVPDCPDAFLDFLYAVRDSGCYEPGVGPPVIHCSAGIGRSGTFCLVDSCLVLAAKGKEVNMHVIRSTLLKMRTQRMGLIQTDLQLRFSVMAILSGMSRLQKENELNSGATANDTATNGHSDNSDVAKTTVVNGKRSAISTVDASPPPSSKKRKNSDS